MTVLLVAVGAGIGAPLRYLVDRAMNARFAGVLPWGTLTVNIGGSLLLGLIVGLPASAHLTALAGTGFCGTLTTYSTFSWETLSLARSGALPRAITYAVLSVTAGLTAASLGLLAAHLL